MIRRTVVNRIVAAVEAPVCRRRILPGRRLAPKRPNETSDEDEQHKAGREKTKDMAHVSLLVEADRPRPSIVIPALRNKQAFLRRAIDQQWQGCGGVRSRR